MEFISEKPLLELVTSVAEEVEDRLILYVSDDVFIDEGLRVIITVVGIFKSWVDFDVDRIVSIDVLDTKSVVIKYGFLMEFIA